MYWTHNLPKAAGFYWYCEFDGFPVVIEYDPGMPWITFTGSDVPAGSFLSRDITGQFWSTPLTPPSIA